MLGCKKFNPEQYYKLRKGEWFIYHVFTDGLDEYVTSINEAVSIVRKWFKEGERNLRIYLEVEDEMETNEITGIFFYGEFPE